MTRIRMLAIAAIGILVLAQAAAADVKIKQKTKNSGFAGLGASEGEEVTLIAVDKMKSTTSTRFTGGVVGFFAGKGPRTQTNITRLDKELIWDINDEDKEYKETTFAQMRAQMEEARAKMKGMEKPEKEEQSDTKINLKWDVKNTGEKRTINGFECNHLILTLTVEEENLKTHEKRDVSYFTMDQWLSATHGKVQAEIEAFHVRMAKAMGIMDGGTDFLSALMAQYGDHLKQLREKSKDLKGFPILSTVMIETVGGGKEGQKEMKEEEEEKPKIELPGGLGGLFGKKKEKEKADESKEEKKAEVKKEESGKPGRSTLFSMTTEVVEMSQTPVSPAEFEVPAGYEKKD